MDNIPEGYQVSAGGRLKAKAEAEIFKERVTIIESAGQPTSLYASSALINLDTIIFIWSFGLNCERVARGLT